MNDKSSSAVFPIKKGDLWIFLIILTAAILLFIWQKFLPQILSSPSENQALTAEVQSLRELILVLPVDTLPDDSISKWVLDGPGGGLLLEYDAGKGFYVQTAACPDLVCVGTGYINKAGQSIVCLPNEIIIRLSAGDRGEILDGILR